MRLVTWNCNGALRKKFQHLLKLNSDIYIVQECENPRQTQHKGYLEWAMNYVWIGDNKHKGLGIFTNKNVDLKPLKWHDQFNGHPVKDHAVKYFSPCLINNDFQLLGVWTHQNNSPNFGYIGQLWKYLQLNKNEFQNIIIAGDFNSNTVWDNWDRWWNHSDVIRELKELKIESLYHSYFKEEQGKESIPTFFLNRKLERPYHIDYVFASTELSSKLAKLQVGKIEKWLTLSDHLPMIIDFDDPKHENDFG